MQTLNSKTVLHVCAFHRHSRAHFVGNNSALYTTRVDKNLYWFWKPKLLWITAREKQWSSSEKSHPSERFCAFDQTFDQLNEYYGALFNAGARSVNCRRFLMHYERTKSRTASILPPLAIAIQLTSHSILQDCFILFYLIARDANERRKSRDKGTRTTCIVSRSVVCTKSVDFGVINPANQSKSISELEHEIEPSVDCLLGKIFYLLWYIFNALFAA